MLFESMETEVPAIDIPLGWTPSDEELLVIRCPLEPCMASASGGVAVAQAGLVDAEPDWFEMALQAEVPAARPVRNSWGDDDEEPDEEIPDEETSEEEEDPDPFEDFDEEDFDDDFDDDFEEELEDEYEIEPKDDGFVLDGDTDDDEDLLDDDAEEVPGAGGEE